MVRRVWSPRTQFVLWILGTLLVLPPQVIFLGAAVLCVGAPIVSDGYTWSTLAILPLSLAAVALLVSVTLQLALVPRVLWWRYRLRRSEVALAQHSGRTVPVRSLDIRIRVLLRHGLDVDYTPRGVHLSAARAREFAPVSPRWAHPVAVPRLRGQRTNLVLALGGGALFIAWLLVFVVVQVLRTLLGN